MSTNYSAVPKIAVIGAGSYVFSLSLLHDLIMDHRMGGIHLVLMDIDAEMADDMARIARRMAGDAGIEIQVDATDNRVTALEGASFVTTSVAVQLARRWQMDREIVRRHGIREVLSECGGVGGLSYTLRSVPLILDIARDIERHCPDAWLLNMTNPLPRVATGVVRHTSVKTIGFCNASWGDVDGYGHLARLLGRDKHNLDVVSAGLNHFAWLVSIRDRTTGEDLLPAVNAAYAEGKGLGGSLSHRFWREYGAAPLSGDTHTGEYLPFYDELGDEHGFHGDEGERAARRQEIREAAGGERPWSYLTDNYGRSWERPADVIESLVTGIERHMDMVNIPNNGAILDLPDNAIVEVPARVTDGTVRGVEIGRLPGRVGEICNQVSAVHELAVKAAVSGDRSVVGEVVRIDPAITDKEAGLRAIDEMIRVHADLLPQFD